MHLIVIISPDRVIFFRVIKIVSSIFHCNSVKFLTDAKKKGEKRFHYVLQVSQKRFDQAIEARNQAEPNKNLNSKASKASHKVKENRTHGVGATRFWFLSLATRSVIDKWLAYAPVKNNPEDAAKVPKGNPCHSATSGEMAIYRANSLILRKAGIQVANPVLDVFNGQEVEVWPRITWNPKWRSTFVEIKNKVSGNSSISQNSTIVIKGRDLSLDGALVVEAIEKAKVTVEGAVHNKGCSLEKVDYKDCSAPEEVRIRGFRIQKSEHLEQNYSEPGDFSLKL